MPTTAAEFKEALGAEYGVYVAVVPIDIAGARAFNVGDPVPVSHVERDIVKSDQVAKRATKAAEAAQDVAPAPAPAPVGSSDGKAV
jgi:hypothetical protein